MRRTLARAAAGLVIAAGVALGVLWLRADRDLAYVLRVLVHRDSSTSDYRWKRAAAVPPAPTPRPWPVALDCATVARAFAAEPGPALDERLATDGTLALVVVRDGALTCERYPAGGGPERPAALFSVSKTITSLLVARAVAAGALPSLDERITRWVPVIGARDPRLVAIDLAALLDMRSGLAYREEARPPWVDQDAPAVYYASDLATTVLRRARREAAPGGFVYNDYGPNLLGLALERATGARAPALTAALWAELGAESAASWSVDDEGLAWFESGLVATARDLARVGQLVLDGGKVGDRQVAPPAFIARSLDPAGRAPVVDFGGVRLGYRNGWWVLGDGALAGMGRHGQILLVSPATRTVIVRLGESGHAETNAALVSRLARVAARLAGR